MPPINTSNQVQVDLGSAPQTPLTASRTQLRVPPNTPANGNPRIVFNDLNGILEPNFDQKELVNLETIIYVGVVDQNLICPICRDPLVDPVDLSCSHTFCRQCIYQALNTQRSCPIDRLFINDIEPVMRRTTNLIVNQLDALIVKCPNCEHTGPRSLIDSHVQKVCSRKMVRCYGECERLVERQYSDRCYHVEVSCYDCHEVLQMIDLKRHRDTACAKNLIQCERCGKKILKGDINVHEKVCTHVVLQCQHAYLGCNHESIREVHAAHYDSCAFGAAGKIVERLLSETTAVRQELGAMRELEDRRERLVISLLQQRTAVDPSLTRECQTLSQIFDEQQQELDHIALSLQDVIGYVETLKRHGIAFHERLADLQSAVRYAKIHAQSVTPTLPQLVSGPGERENLEPSAHPKVDRLRRITRHIFKASWRRH